MKSLLSGMLAAATLVLIACNNETDKTTTTDSSTINTDTINAGKPMDDTAAVMPMAGHAEASLAGTSPDTSVTGTVKFDTVGNKVKMVLELTVPSKAGKQVAVHLHEHGDCGDKGNMAHGHWNPSGKQHGKWGSASFHAGDIGNVKLDSKGRGTLTINTDLWTLGGAASTNIIGKAVIVHGGVDDYTTQPTGNAGSRIGCGVIK
jgi:Cu-Zn family superoxide dismutase